MMTSLMKTLAVAASTTVLLSTSALADIAVSFDEGAPKDRFTFKNVGSCAIKASQLTLDLSGSQSGLIFDVTSKGAGVEVFQPLEFVAGQKALSSSPQVKDGDNKVVLNIRELAAGARIAFTIDVDDTMGGREITVSGSEIAGAKVRLASKGSASDGVFSSKARARVSAGACT